MDLEKRKKIVENHSELYEVQIWYEKDIQLLKAVSQYIC